MTIYRLRITAPNRRELLGYVGAGSLVTGDDAAINCDKSGIVELHATTSFRSLAPAISRLSRASSGSRSPVGFALVGSRKALPGRKLEHCGKPIDPWRTSRIIAAVSRQQRAPFERTGFVWAIATEASSADASKPAAVVFTPWRPPRQISISIVAGVAEFRSTPAFGGYGVDRNSPPGPYAMIRLVNMRASR